MTIRKRTSVCFGDPAFQTLNEARQTKRGSKPANKQASERASKQASNVLLPRMSLAGGMLNATLQTEILSTDGKSVPCNYADEGTTSKATLCKLKQWWVLGACK